MRILFMKAVRDMWHAKLRTMAIIVAIFISVGCGIGLVNATRDILNTYDERLVDTHYEDIAIQFQMDEQPARARASSARKRFLRMGHPPASQVSVSG